MARQLTGHMVNGCNCDLQIIVRDEPGHGGACHEYQIVLPPKKGGPADFPVFDVFFQNGPIEEVGTNGVTHEALIAILIDHLEGLQSGPYACDDNQEALDALRTAQTALQRRTVANIAKGVEGTHPRGISAYCRWRYLQSKAARE